jgi:hypothetical protein
MAVSLGILSVLRRLARVEAGWCDFAILVAKVLGEREIRELSCSSAGLVDSGGGIREVFCAGGKRYH